MRVCSLANLHSSIWNGLWNYHWSDYWIVVCPMHAESTDQRILYTVHLSFVSNTKVSLDRPSITSCCKHLKQICDSDCLLLHFNCNGHNHALPGAGTECCEESLIRTMRNCGGWCSPTILHTKGHLFRYVYSAQMLPSKTMPFILAIQMCMDFRHFTSI